MTLYSIAFQLQNFKICWTLLASITGCFQASAAKQMRSKLFWVIRQRVVVISCRIFGKTSLKMWSISCAKTLAGITTTRCVIIQRSEVLCNHYCVKFIHSTATDLYMGESFRISCSCEVNIKIDFWCDFDRASSLICGNKMLTRCNRGFYCRSYCSLNMFRAPLCPSSGAQEYYTVVAACGIPCCGFQVAGLVWSW